MIRCQTTKNNPRSLNRIQKSYRKRFRVFTKNRQDSRRKNMTLRPKSNNSSRKQNSLRRTMSVLHVPKILVKNSAQKKSTERPRQRKLSIRHYKTSLPNQLRWNQILKSHFKFKKNYERLNKIWLMEIKPSHGLIPRLVISEEICQKLSREELILEKRLMNSMFSPLKKIRSWNANLNSVNNATTMT